VIKRIRFAPWSPAVAEAPAEVRPVRITVSTTMPELTGPDPRHDGFTAEWFADAVHLARFESWCAAGKGQSAEAAGPVIIVDEHVLRGADWLEGRWRDGGPKLKHLAMALRREDLSAAEFAERWKDHAGFSGSSVIPDAARGLAYVQNHPVPRSDGEWAYDAVNEVWFDDLEGLQARIEWFAVNPPDHRADDLFRQSWFLAAREDVVA
jgi:hypothetical protein